MRASSLLFQMTDYNEKQKVTFFLTGLFGGGGERVILDLAHGLARAGTPVDIVVMQKKGAFSEQVGREVNLVDLSCSRVSQSIPRLARYLRRERPRAVIATSEHAHVALVLARMLSFTHPKVILRIGIAFSVVFKRYKKLRDKMLAFFAPVIYRRADAIVCVSKGIAADFMEEVGVAENKLHIIYNPKPIEEIRKKAETHIDHPWLADKNMPVVLGIGRLREQKDFATLIKAVARARTDIPNLHLIILGEGEERDTLLEVAQKEGIADVVDMLGFVENPYAYLKRADVFVLSSLWEGLPNALIEALIVGTPVIATDCPYGPREILAPDLNIDEKEVEKKMQGTYGMLVPTGNVDEMQSSIVEMVKSEEVKEKYKAAGSSRAEDFGISYIVHEYKELWK